MPKRLETFIESVVLASRWLPRSLGRKAFDAPSKSA